MNVKVGWTMNEKKLGILGGMGPKATSVFFDKLIERTVANSDQDHIDAIIVNHASLPDRTNVIKNEQKQLFLEAVEQDLKLLELAKVSHIAIPCNTSHYFYDDLQAMTTVPIINMVEETIKHIQSTLEHRDDASRIKIALLATDGTVQSGIYRAWCEHYGVKLQVPDAEKQQEVMDIIYQVKSGNMAQADRLAALITYFIEQEQCHTVILACTELSCLELSDDELSDEFAGRYIDAMEVLIKQAIVRSDKEAK